ncbi:MAG: hypothetical protein EOM03_03350 [Clostridia bacterium]|nr:hypothetical protein [Clostridia bacterium]
MNKTQTKSKQRVADHGEVFTNELWTDKKIHTRRGVTEEEKNFIDSMVCPMELNGDVTYE